jgi:hypothetical protein
MAEPGNELAAGGNGRLRASRADREQVIEVLKTAFVQERLDEDEFELRVGRALAARTYADLAALTADIPVRLTGARSPEAARDPANKKVVALVCATPALAGSLAALLAMPGGTPWQVVLLVAAVTLVLLLAVPTGWLVLLHAWLDQRAGGQSAPGLPPGAGGRAPATGPQLAGPAADAADSPGAGYRARAVSRRRRWRTIQAAGRARQAMARRATGCAVVSGVTAASSASWTVSQMANSIICPTKPRRWAAVRP